MNKANPPHSGPGGIGVVIGAVALVLCCAGPALIAGGALSAIGGALSSPIVIAVGVALVVTAIAITLRLVHHRRGVALRRSPSELGPTPPASA